MVPKIFCLVPLKITLFHFTLETYIYPVINQCNKILHPLCHPAGSSFSISRGVVLIPQVDCILCYHFYCFFFQGHLILPRRHSGTPMALYIS